MGKHSSESKSGKGKKVFFVIIFLILLVAIGIVIFNNMISKQTPEDSINNAFQAIKSYDVDNANKYIDYNQLIYSLDEMLVQGKNEGVCKELFKDLEWKVENTEVNNDKATAIVEVKNKDFIKVMTNWMKKIIGEKAKVNQITIDVSLQKLENALSETGEVTTVMKKINLTKEDDTWKIIVDEELRSLVYPSIDSVATSLTQSGN